MAIARPVTAANMAIPATTATAIAHVGSPGDTIWFIRVLRCKVGNVGHPTLFWGLTITRSHLKVSRYHVDSLDLDYDLKIKKAYFEILRYQIIILE